MKRRTLCKSWLGAIALSAIPIVKARGSTWSYAGKTGKDFWGELDPEYRVCSSGQAQSPIDLKSAVASDISDLKFDYRDTPLTITNDGHTVKVSYQPGSSLTLGDRVYQLIQFHFHQPSEHLVSGKTARMEAHFVHQDRATEKLLVLAVLIEPGRINRALETIWQKIPTSDAEESRISDLVINASQLLPENCHQYYRYQGSLTTPPCTENVTWLVLKQPVEVSELQIARFSKIIGNNARPVRALNRRIVLEYD